MSAPLSIKRAQPSPNGRGWPRSGRVRGYAADRFNPPSGPRSFPLTPDLRSDPLPPGEGGAARNLRRRASPSLSIKRAQPSPLGRAQPRSGRARGCRAARLRAPLRPGSLPLTPALWTDPLPLGEGGAARNLTPHLRDDPLPRGEGATNLFSVETKQRRSRRLCASNIGGPKDFLQHPIQSFFHVIVGEAQFQITVTFDRSAARGVGKRLIGMMAAIEFDGESEAAAAEVCDISRNRSLTAKLVPMETRGAQFAPENFLGTRALAPQSARDGNVLARHLSIKSQNSIAGNPSPGRSAAALSHRERVRSARSRHVQR